MLKRAQNIVERLARADREHQKEAGGRLLLRAIKYLCGAVLGLFVLDVAFHLGSGWRLGLLLGLLAGVIGLGALAWYVAYIRRNRLEHIARFLETRSPELGSRLINLLQLQDQVEDPKLPPLTRDLARQAIEGYSEDLREHPLERLAWTGVLRRDMKRAAWALLIFAAVLASFFQITRVEMARFLDPFGDHPPFSFTQLEIVTPGQTGTNVLYGRGMVVRAKATGHQPKEVLLSYFSPEHPDDVITVPMFDKGKVGFDQLVDNIRTELVVYAHTRDRVSISKQARIGVILTPKLEKAVLEIIPPAYTGLKSSEKPYDFKGFQALAGSEVRFRLQSNRPLRQGTLEITAGDQAPQLITLTNTAEREVGGSFTARDTCRLRFALTDTAGLPSQDDWQGALTVTHDLPPEIRITEPAGDAFVSMDFKLKVHIEANDDYGLRTVRIHRGLNGVYGPARVVSFEGAHRQSHQVVDLNIADLGVQPDDEISVFAEAIDSAPEPHLARSQTIRLMVISVEDYNNFLRQQTDLAETQAKYEGLMDDLQEMIEAQKDLGKQAESLQGKLEKASPEKKGDLTQALDELMAKQSELNQKLRQHADRMDEFVRENPLYDVEKELQDLLRPLAEKIRNSTSTNDAASKSVAQRSLPASGNRQVSPDMAGDLKSASDEQVKQLEGVQQETMEQVAQTLQDMSLMQELQKDFNQFEALYEAQKELTAQVQAYNRQGQLSREDQLALKELASTEKQIGDLLKQLEGKLKEDADAAEKLFPKAAQSARELAEAIESARMEQLAHSATDQMLAGKGDRSFRLADRLREEMDKLYKECQGGNCPNGDELDQYLALQRSMKSGRSFGQMGQSQKFGKGQNPGSGMGMGMGATGTSGYAMMNGAAANLIGNEQQANRGNATARQAARQGKGQAETASRSAAANEEASESLKGVIPTNRQSGAVAPDKVAAEYTDLVDQYFRAITTRKTP